MSNIGVGTFVEDQHEKNSDPFDLFSSPNVVTQLIHGKTNTYYPFGPITDTGPYEFIIPGDSDFVDMPFTRLNGELQITKPDGTDIGDTELNAYVNLLPQTIFRQVECRVGDHIVSDLSTPTYAYKAYIETHLGFTKEQKEIMFRALEYYNKDTIDKEEVFLINDATAKSFIARHGKLKLNNGKIPFSMILHVDFLNCHKPLLPHVEMRLKFIRSDDSFSLLGATKAVKIKVNELSLDVRKITLDPQLTDSIERELSNTPAIYNITSGKIKTHIITTGRQSERVSQIFRGKLPRQIIIGFVDSGGSDGNINRNPFKFANFGINSFQGYINGEPITPQPFKPKFSTDSYVKEYRWFLDNLGCYESKNPLDVTYEEFKSNSCFFVYDMSPEWCNLFHQHGNQSGVFDFDVGFETALTKNITAIIYGSFHEVVMIDKSRNVTIVE
jgi:hypothetical protein